MALNKYMHSRNIYRKPPDFKKLYKEYAEFANIAKVDINNKVSIDFKDPNSLRVLTKCLLQSDFNLKVKIPENRLVPTLPLRLNYILWIEDLVTNRENVKGIDIGTGACAIYPLLGAVKNKWHMTGTELDEFSIEMAQKNVETNNLSQLIKIVKTSELSLLRQLFEENNDTYDFCMCNPPFYSSVQELIESRSPARPPPKNGFTGSPQELITDGGELEYIRKIIAESQFLKNKIQIFTSMVGHKYNLKILLEDLKSEGISYTHTEFCQGRVTRWGLAWTFSETIKLPMQPKEKQDKKSNMSKTYKLPKLPNMSYELQQVNNKLNKMLVDISIATKIISKSGSCIVMDIVAETNSWCNQRRKRRMMKQIQASHAKIQKIDSDFLEINQNVPLVEDSDEADIRKQNTKIEEGKTGSADTEIISDPHKSSLSVSECDTDESNIHSKDSKEPVIHALVKLMKNYDKDIVVAIEFLNGSGGKQGIHEILQYIQNNWK